MQKYDGDGYIYDLPYNINRTSWQSNITSLNASNYIDQSTRAVFLYINFYNPSQDLFISTEILFEFSNTGLVTPNHINVRTFKAYVFGTASERGVRTAEFFRLFCIFYIGYFLVFLKFYKIYRCYKTKSTYKNSGKTNILSMIFDFKLVLELVIDISIMCLVFITFVMVHVASDKTSDEIINSNEYVDLVYKGELYDNVYILEGITQFLLVLKVLHVLTLIKLIRIIHKTTTLAFKQILTYMVIILPLVIAFTLIGMGIYGPFLNEYSTFGNSFVSVLFFSVGQSNTTELMKFNSFWAVVYVVIVTFIIYLFTSSLIAVYTDAYLTTIMNEGYPSDEIYQSQGKEDLATKTSQWTVRDALLWALDLMPNRWLIKIGILTQKDMEKVIGDKDSDDDSGEHDFDRK